MGSEAAGGGVLEPVFTGICEHLYGVRVEFCVSYQILRMRLIHPSIHSINWSPQTVRQGTANLSEFCDVF